MGLAPFQPGVRFPGMKAAKHKADDTHIYMQC